MSTFDDTSLTETSDPETPLTETSDPESEVGIPHVSLS